jgi:hypothetical protein
MKDPIARLLSVICGFLFACCLALAGAVGYLEPLRQVQAERIQTLESDVRTYRGKLVKQEEAHEDEMRNLSDQQSVWLFKVEGELAACRSGKK